MIPCVSVLIIAYNKADTLPAAIDSVLRQTYTDFEILVIDDGSTDDTAERIKPYGHKIRTLIKENGGTGSARNLGIRSARGKYVAFLDGDDLWLPNKLEVQMRVFDREPGLIASQTSAYCVDPHLNVIEIRRCTPSQDTLMDFLLFQNLPAFSSTLVADRERIEALGGFGTDLVILSDWDMACRLSQAGTLRSVPDLLTLYRHYPSNQSRNVDIHIESGERSMARFFSNPNLDPAIRAREPWIRARFDAMLAGGYVRNGLWGKGLLWSWKAIRRSPRVLPYIAGMPFRRLLKTAESRNRLSFGHLL